MFGSLGDQEFAIIAVVLFVGLVVWKFSTGKVAGELPPAEAARLRAEGRAARSQQPEPSVPKTAIDLQTGLKRCPFCAEDIQAAAIVCKHCGRALEGRTLDDRGARQAFNPGVAALLSLIIPGAGQMYKGNVGGGLAWFICVFIGYLMLIVPGLILHIICIFSAATKRA